MKKKKSAPKSRGKGRKHPEKHPTHDIHTHSRPDTRHTTENQHNLEDINQEQQYFPDLPREKTTRRTSRVPGAEAFDHIPRRMPPTLPGYENDRIRKPEPARVTPEEEVQGKSRKAKAKTKTKTNANANAKNNAKAGEAAKKPKKKVKKRKPVSPARRRRNRNIIGILVLLALIGAGVWFSITTLFKIDKFTVEGNIPYTQEELVVAFGYEKGSNLFSFGSVGAAAQIEKTLPYIETVVIRRRLPGTVIFRAKAATEAYYIPVDGQFAILSDKCKVLRISPDMPLGITRIEGLTGVVIEPGLPLKLEEGLVSPESAVSSELAEGASSEPLPTEPLEEGQEEALAPPEGEGVPVDGQGEPPVEGEGEPVLEGEAPIEEVPPPPEEPAPIVSLDPAASLDALGVLLDSLTASGLEEITWIDVSDTVNLRFCWQDRIIIVIGSRANLTEKLKFVEVLLGNPEESGITAGDRGTLDVSAYPDLDRVWLTRG